jgi:hypothetical protein
VNKAHFHHLIRCREAAGNNWRSSLGQNRSAPDDRGSDAARGDHRLSLNAEVFRRLLRFEPIPSH